MILQNFFSIIFIFSLTVHVRSQTCENTYPSSPCSSNAACGCIPLALSDEIGICGVSGVNCARLSSCDADFACPSANQICLSHSRCGITPVCYPMSMADARLCPPPITTATTTTAATTTTTITASFPTTEEGVIFETTINNHFTDETETFFTSNTTDYDYTTATASYPTNRTLSTYLSALTTNSSINLDNGKYYELIQISINTTGEYQIRSVSFMDTYGCIYDEIYNSSESTNVTDCNDDYNGNQFQLNVYLEAGVSYILNFTTYSPNVLGTYTVEVYGPDTVQFYPIYVEQVTTTTTFPTNETETENNATTYGSSVISIYSSSLSDHSPRYPQFSRYYEAINVTVYTSGQYIFRSEENLDGMGYLYHSYFNASDDTKDLVANDDQSGGNNQFSFTVYLEAGISYVLVFTTYSSNVSGRFTIIISGPDTVSFDGTSTTASFEYTTNSIPSTTSFTNSLSIITSEYSSELTTDTNYFDRLSGSGYQFYYEAIEIKTNTLGVYTFISQQNSSEFISANDSSMSYDAIDSYGYLYKDNFFPLSPSTNLAQMDDDGGDNRQFRLIYTLETDKTYVIVFTTYLANTTGSFSIKATGPDYVTFTHLNI